jgi:lipopolysaccharide transport system permease protein
MKSEYAVKDLETTTISASEREDNSQWTTVIRPWNPWFKLDLLGIWHYRDLIWLFVRRDFVAKYKQTILGPLWFIIQPLTTTLVFTIVFGKIAKIPTEGVPSFLFFLAGNIVWGYFSGCLTDTSTTFTTNAGLFGKVYFPRLTVPTSIVISKIAQFAIQFSVFIAFYAYFFSAGSAIVPNLWALALPLLLVQMALLGLGTGILISSLTTKYRDLSFAVSFGVQLWMYATPIVYPLSQIPERFHTLFSLNPMTAIVETFRYGFFGKSAITALDMGISWAITLCILMVGVVLFNRVEKIFMDTV